MTHNSEKEERKMRMRFLGKTGLQVSELCLGTGTFGATGTYARGGHVTQKEADYVISMALDAGLNFFNTAERYSYGVAEEVFGKALGNKRKEAIIITKISPARWPGPNDGGLSRKHIIEGCNASLKRLNTDYIDLYEIHEFDEHTPLEVSLRALDDLVRDGKVRYIGCSNFTGWQLMKSLGISDRNGWERFSSLEVRYSLVSRMPEYELVPVCLDQDVAILPWSPLHGGYLSGKYRRNEPLPEGTRFSSMEDKFFAVDSEKLFTIVDELSIIAREHNATIPQAALNYLLKKPGVVSLIMGMRTSQQCEENLKTMEWELTDEEVARLDSISEPLQDYPYYTWDPEQKIYIKH
jgi:aryl-alcohol dehydrogenase-like predicted oxidoreductase